MATSKHKKVGNKASRIRYSLRQKGTGRIRLSVYRSIGNIYAQIIDDSKGSTLASASTLEKELKAKLNSGGNVKAAKEVGLLVAKRAKEAGIEKVVFDRGPHIYHGRVKALADAAREGGLEF